MNSQRVKVVLNPDRDEDRRILVFLQSADEPMSKVFKAAMLQYVESSIGGVNHEKLLRDIREIVHEELQLILRQLSLIVQGSQRSKSKEYHMLLEVESGRFRK